MNSTPMRFHVVSLPHTQTTKEFLPCAYTQKVVNFCRMMKSLGHVVFLYASEDNDAPCDELITCITKAEQVQLLGENDWKKKFFKLDWNHTLPYWALMNARAVDGIKKRAEAKDFVCLIGGNCQKPVADALPAMTSVEFGVGYEGTFSKYRVFESYAWMHYVAGLTRQNNGNYYDAVIPNYFDPADFPEPVETPDDYYLFIGRLIDRKGIRVAADTCLHLGGKKLVIAGQGGEVKDGKLYGDGFEVHGNVEYVGTVGVEERGRLMSRARAVFVPTQYFGPFEGVHAEAMLCGTPVITTDWGVFSETVMDGVDGFRCRTLGENMWAGMMVDLLDRKEIRRRAVARFSMDVVKYRYQDYFKSLLGLWEPGVGDWYRTDHDPGDKRERGNFR